ncbi:hypothetical protein [Litoreibacter halocynthiae]|uniref:hypothetical protein n=1 Tax=Litoreibacter halocynthiae TaxID=1242689 RepID=UPI0024927838|nr:hypothetical protein [Litoreibacter halocynthiae]
MLDEIRERYGHGRVIDLRTKHIEADLNRFAGHVRNNHLKAWRGFGNWLAETYNITDPTTDAKKSPVAQSDGHPLWSEEEIEAFRAYWPTFFQKLAHGSLDGGLPQFGVPLNRSLGAPDA